MGRKSGSLALGMCKAAGATLAVIPEEFPDDVVRFDVVVDTIVGSIVKRRASGHDHGVAVVAEGIAERLARRQLEHFDSLARDAYGHVRLADVPLGAVLRDAVRKRLDEIGVDMTVVHTRTSATSCAARSPSRSMLEYTRTLGYGAVRYLFGGGSGALIALSGGRVEPVKLADLLDPATGRIRTRQVDTSSQGYRVARDYMVRLEPPDFSNPERLAKLPHRRTSSPRSFAIDSNMSRSSRL